MLNLLRHPSFGLLPATLALGACGTDYAYDPRGVDYDETLLSVSASGDADTRPDEARFQAGVDNWAATAVKASEQTAADIEAIVSALRALGIAEKDIQTRAVSVSRIDWGDRKGQYQASNVVTVRVRDIAKAGESVTAVTGVGANIVSGPDLRLSDPEAAANTAYGNAFRAARARAEAYADAAGMEVARVLSIRDAGGSQGDSRYFAGAIPPPPPPPPVSPRPVVRTQSASPMLEQGYDGGTIMAGQTTSTVNVQVDFALREK